jgi:hypothetical protein
MMNFIKEAYFAIKYMGQYCTALGVGVGSGGVPDIKYFDYEQVWDKEPEIVYITGFETYANARLEQVKQKLRTYNNNITSQGRMFEDRCLELGYRINSIQAALGIVLVSLAGVILPVTVVKIDRKP